MDRSSLGQGARSGGLTHSFTWYAWNTVMVHNKAILARFSKSDFLTLISKTLSVFWMLSLHWFDMWPEDKTLNGTRNTWYPLSSRSMANCVYLISLKVWALRALPGNGQVNSSNAIVFLTLFKITRSGFEPSRWTLICRQGSLFH